MTKELKPCPFCGGRNPHLHEHEITCRPTEFFVKCNRPWCGAESGHFHTEQEAIAAWNTRTELTCEGCIENDKTDNGDLCEMCSRCHPDLYKPKAVE